MREQGLTDADHLARGTGEAGPELLPGLVNPDFYALEWLCLHQVCCDGNESVGCSQCLQIFAGLIASAGVAAEEV